MEMMGDDPNMCHMVGGLQQDFSDCHFSYMYQGIHMLSYMQYLQKGCFAGLQGMLFPGGRVEFNYAGRFEHGKNTYLFSYSPVNQQEQLSMGIVGRPSRNLNLFSEFKIGQHGASEMEGGFRIRFPEWTVTGSMNSAGKAMSVYRRSFEIFEVTWQGSVDFMEPKKAATFGVGLTFGMGGGM